PGTYRLINYTGTLTNTSPLVVGTVPSGFSAGNLSIVVDAANKQVNLVVTGGGFTYWDGPAGNTSSIEGGSGAWTASGLNWTTSTGAPNGNWSAGSVATFGVNSGSSAVTVSGTRNIAGLTFSTTGYTLSGGSLEGVTPINALITASGVDATVTSVLTGANAFSKEGEGTLVLRGSNTYTGNTAVNAGMLALAGSLYGGTGAGSITVASGATLRLDSAGFGNHLANPLSTITVNGGSLTNQISLITLKDVTLNGGTVTANGVPVCCGWGSFAFKGTLTSSGASSIVGAGSPRRVHIGTNSINGSTTFNITGSVLSVDPEVTDNKGSDGATAVASGPTKTGTGVLAFSGPNTYTGVTLVSAGTLAISHATALGTTAAGTSVSNGATLAMNGGIAVGAEALSLDGAGTSGNGALSNTTGANTYEGAITLAAASTIGSATGTLTLSNTLANSGFALTLEGAGSIAAGGIVSGSGGLVKQGNGVTTLSAANTYTGATAVNAGRLLVNGNQSAATGAVSVASGATLGGSGTLGGVVTVSSGGTLAPGNSPGVITVSGLVLSSGSILSMELGQAGTAGGSLNDLVQDNGNLTLAGGTVNIAQSSGGSFGLGTYRLINYTGTLTNTSPLVIGTVPSGFSAGNLSIVVDAANKQVNLVVSGGGFTYWDGPATNTTTIEGGSAAWSATFPGWTTSTGTPNGAWSSGGVAVFATAAGLSTVNVVGTLNIGGLTFNAPGYTIN
ncbi:MAG: hypothetical protein EON54_15090, partial [Alcaligenaceae bacterium]